MAIKNAASVGQAINLAAADARQSGRESDVRYIYQRFVFWTVVCDALHGSDIEMVQEVINDASIDTLIKQLKEALK